MAETSPVIVAEAYGPKPFVTRRVYRDRAGARCEWSSRHHRKAIAMPGSVRAEHVARLLLQCLWMPGDLNWWIGAVFAIGSTLFATGGVLTLNPSLVSWLGMSTTEVNAVFFAGSIPFTTAAYLELFQAGNAGRQPGGRWRIIGWRPGDLGWLSCLLQWLGTIMFNFNTFDATLPGLVWWESDLAIWTPNMIGSVLFLVSGYMMFGEVCHAYWGWRFSDLSWWSVFVNLGGCAWFMLSGLTAFYLPGGTSQGLVTFSVFAITSGAVCFFVGSVLMLPEAATARLPRVDRSAEPVERVDAVEP
ncbi:MAG: hypothetical protein AAGK09_08960 [Planctomycetota bacterium]